MGKPKLGRPPRNGKVATDLVRLRVTPEERKAWQRSAGDRPLSEWIRERCNAND